MIPRAAPSVNKSHIPSLPQNNPYLPVGKINWAEIPVLDYRSCAYKIVIEEYIATYDRCFPLKRKKVKRFNLRKPWFTKGLAKSVKKKNMLLVGSDS